MKLTKEEKKQLEKASSYKSIVKRYEYIYDTVCDFLDSKYIGCNYCDFKDDVCKYFRVKDPKHKMGCCYSDARGGLCPNLDKATCKIKSISCKLYACPMLRDEKLYFKVNDIPLLKYNFNLRQKWWIKQSFFKTKEETLMKLYENKYIYEVIDNNLEIFVTENNKKKIFRMLKQIVRYCDKHNYTITINSFLDNKLNRELHIIEKGINIKDKEKRYSYVYDEVCKILDEKVDTNYCEFKNDTCYRDRLKNNGHKNGCCECEGRGKCKFLINGVCTMKSCMACKLFTCAALRKKGINEKATNYLPLKVFFTSKQRDILSYSYWTPKEVVIKRLLDNKFVMPKNYDDEYR
ncbi:MAG: hypothetical protein IKP98_04305 [Bacilli bacterium]|nr:hypothetical protein [Bacilli bacterium]